MFSKKENICDRSQIFGENDVSRLVAVPSQAAAIEKSPEKFRARKLYRAQRYGAMGRE